MSAALAVMAVALLVLSRCVDWKGLQQGVQFLKNRVADIEGVIALEMLVTLRI